MTAHLDEDSLLGLVRGQLESARQVELNGHIDQCEACRQRLAELRETTRPVTKRFLGVVKLGALFTVVALGVSAYLLAGATSRCEVEARRLTRSWTPERRQALTQAFERSGVPHRAELLSATLRALDGYAAELGAALTQTCARRSSPTREQQLSCVGQRLSGFESLVTALENPEATQVRAAPWGAATLRTPKTCLSPRQVAVGPEVFAIADLHRTEDLERRLFRAQTLRRTGLDEAALAQGRSVAQDAAALGHRLVQAEALLLVGSIEAARGEPTAEQALLSAIRTAVSGRHADAAVRAWTELAMFQGTRSERLEQAQTSAQLALATLEGFGEDSELEAQVQAALGEVALRRGELSTAEEALALSLRLTEESRGASHASVVPILSSVSAVEQRQGRGGRAIEALTRALTIAEGQLGAEHAQSLATLTELGRLRLEGKDTSEGLRLLGQALARLEHSQGKDNPAWARAAVGLSHALVAARRQSEAMPLLEGVVDYRARANADAAELAELLALQGRCLLELGKPAEALPVLTRATELRQTRENDPLALGTTLDLLGRAQWEAGLHDPALASFERAVGSLESAAADPLDLADVRLRLAQALHRRGRKELARQQARQARLTYVSTRADRSGQLELADQILEAR